jgi:hypothetical protein
MASRTDLYSVGYGKPPKHSRFKKGRSGNPKGRRQRNPKTIKAILTDVLNRKLRVREADAYRRVTILELIITQLAIKATKGDDAALTLLLALKQEAKARGEIEQYVIQWVPDEEIEI